MKNIKFLRNGKEFKPTKRQLKIILDDYAFMLIKKTKENQALKDRWEKLKEFVNMPKEIQQWAERFEVTVDSIKAKMQELELADLIERKEQ